MTSSAAAMLPEHGLAGAIREIGAIHDKATFSIDSSTPSPPAEDRIAAILIGLWEATLDDEHYD